MAGGEELVVAAAGDCVTKDVGTATATARTVVRHLTPTRAATPDTVLSPFSLALRAAGRVGP
jgi:hypothetical protein